MFDLRWKSESGRVSYGTYHTAALDFEALAGRSYKVEASIEDGRTDIWLVDSRSGQTVALSRATLGGAEPYTPPAASSFVAPEPDSGAPASAVSPVAARSSPRIAAPADAYFHVPSGLAVSRAAGAFRRTRLSEPNVGGHSMLIADYESDTPAGPALASLRIARPDAQETGKPARQVCDDQMQAAADAVISGRDVTRIAERDVALLRNGLPVPGRMMGFRYDVAGAATEEYFYLFCDVGGGWALTHRVSFPQGQFAPAALDAFVQQAAVVPEQADGQALPVPSPAAARTYSGTPIQDTPPVTEERETSGYCGGYGNFGFYRRCPNNDDPNAQ